MPLQPPLEATEEFGALLELLHTATKNQDLSVLDIFDIDNVPVSVLPHLAEQFDVLGYKGWLLADTEAKKRQLIKDAIEIHKRAGTPDAIKKALASVGYPVKEIIENPTLFYDGTWSLNGVEYLGGKRWCRFIVIFEVEPPPDKLELINNLIETWKPVRSYRLDPTSLLIYDGTWSLDGVELLDGIKD